MTNEIYRVIMSTKNKFGGQVMVKEKLNTMAIKVEEILKNKVRARDDDNVLYAYFLNSLGVSVRRTSFWEIIRRVVNGDLPSIESVGRVRRKIQELNPELVGTAEKRKIRYKAIDDYKEFARQKEL